GSVAIVPQEGASPYRGTGQGHHHVASHGLSLRSRCPRRLRLDRALPPDAARGQGAGTGLPLYWTPAQRTEQQAVSLQIVDLVAARTVWAEEREGQSALDPARMALWNPTTRATWPASCSSTTRIFLRRTRSGKTCGRRPTGQNGAFFKG